MIKDARVVCGGVSCVPRVVGAAADAAKGSKQDEETGMVAGKAASHGARPLNYNHYKIPLVENLVKRAIRDAV